MSSNRTRAARRRLSVALAAAWLAAGWTGSARALCAASVDPSYVDSITDDPRSLLRQHPRGGEPLTFKIRQLAVQGTRVLKAVGTIVPQANSPQKEAIGRGLANAAGACTARSPVIARQITDMVRASSDHDVMRVYARFFSAPEDNQAGRNATLPSDPRQDRRGRMPDVSSGFAPRMMPLGDPFAKP